MRPSCRKLALGLVLTVLGLLVAGVTAVVPMFRVHDQHVRIYSVTPGGKLQVIGLCHRSYILDCGGGSQVVLFSNTVGTGVVTYGSRGDIGPGPEDIAPAPLAAPASLQNECSGGG
jgi:hypothetical protein